LTVGKAAKYGDIFYTVNTEKNSSTFLGKPTQQKINAVRLLVTNKTNKKLWD
jgi:hypothetical protein